MGSQDLQGIFPTKGSNLGFLHCRLIHLPSTREAPNIGKYKLKPHLDITKHCLECYNLKMN